MMLYFQKKISKFRWGLKRALEHGIVPASQTDTGKQLLTALRSTGMWTGKDYHNPIDNIGEAFRLARKYNIELSGGLTYGDCRAALPTSKWVRSPRVPHVNYIPMGEWVVRTTVQEAVVACLINCHEIGILDPIEGPAI